MASSAVTATWGLLFSTNLESMDTLELSAETLLAGTSGEGVGFRVLDETCGVVKGGLAIIVPGALEGTILGVMLTAMEFSGALLTFAGCDLD